MTTKRRLVVVSNRLPVVVAEEDGRRFLKPGTGGLITALQPVMEREHGLWIGWAGGEEDTVSSLIDDFTARHSYALRTVSLTPEEVEGFYQGFSNETLWPLFHDLLDRTRFDLCNWRTYNRVNRHFAVEISSALEPDDIVWVHDYQLLMAASHLRELGVPQPLAFFLHIPFPNYDLFRRLPWRGSIISAMLEFDMLGFQTRRDHRNFVDCVRATMDGIRVEFHRRHTIIHYGIRRVKVGHFPISIDFEEFNKGARTKEVAAEAEQFKRDFRARFLLIGVDRLDYTKGVAERFLAFERALEKYPDMCGHVSLFQLLIPSRTEVEEYKSLKSELDQLVGRINGGLSRDGWTPIHYRFRTLTRTQLLGRYRACDVALITPLRDGMNLVAKEYCASQVDRSRKGVLILSEFAGAADQLKRGAVIINPFDLESAADAIHAAWTMDEAEKMRRMNALRSVIRQHDVYEWVKWFLNSFNIMTARGADDPPPGDSADVS